MVETDTSKNIVPFYASDEGATGRNKFALVKFRISVMADSHAVVDCTKAKKYMSLLTTPRAALGAKAEVRDNFEQKWRYELVFKSATNSTAPSGAVFLCTEIAVH